MVGEKCLPMIEQFEVFKTTKNWLQNKKQYYSDDDNEVMKNCQNSNKYLWNLKRFLKFCIICKVLRSTIITFNCYKTITSAEGLPSPLVR